MEICERNADVGVGRGEDAVFGFVNGAGGVDEGAAVCGIDGPDVGDAEGEVVVDALLHFIHTVTWGENFDAEEGRRPNDRTRGALSNKHRNVGDAETPGFDLNALFWYRQNAPLLLTTHQEMYYQSLQTAVIPLAHISLQELAFQIIA